MRDPLPYYDTAMGMGIPDPQDVRPLCRCNECNGDIYPGERVYRGYYSGLLYHMDCLIEVIAGDDD